MLHRPGGGPSFRGPSGLSSAAVPGRPGARERPVDRPETPTLCGGLVQPTSSSTCPVAVARYSTRPRASIEPLRHLTATYVARGRITVRVGREVERLGPGDRGLYPYGTGFEVAHAGEPITVADVAAGAGVGARALQYAFAGHQGTTPMGYLRRAAWNGRTWICKPPTPNSTRSVRSRCGGDSPNDAGSPLPIAVRTVSTLAGPSTPEQPHFSARRNR